MYCLFIDESGNGGIVSNLTSGNFDREWFTAGGIIAVEDIPKFGRAHDSITRKYFTDRGTPLPPNFKLHCHELRRNAHPHDQISRQECRDLADVVFGAMRSIGCSLVSATAHKPSHTSKYPQYGSAGARTLLVRLERFGYFLGDRGDGGPAVCERFAAGLRKRTGGESRVLRSASAFPHFANPDKIKGRTVDGDPTIRVVPQFSDFFAYAPHIKMVAGHGCSSRWDETKDKHYCVDGPRNRRGFVVI